MAPAHLSKLSIFRAFGTVRLETDLPHRVPVTFDGEAAIAAQPRFYVPFGCDLSRSVCIELHQHQPGKSPDPGLPDLQNRFGGIVRLSA